MSVTPGFAVQSAAHGKCRLMRLDPLGDGLVTEATTITTLDDADTAKVFARWLAGSWQLGHGPLTAAESGFLARSPQPVQRAVRQAFDHCPERDEQFSAVTVRGYRVGAMFADQIGLTPRQAVAIIECIESCAREFEDWLSGDGDRLELDAYDAGDLAGIIGAQDPQWWGAFIRCFADLKADLEQGVFPALATFATAVALMFAIDEADWLLENVLEPERDVAAGAAGVILRRKLASVPFDGIVARDNDWDAAVEIVVVCVEDAIGFRFREVPRDAAEFAAGFPVSRWHESLPEITAPVSAAAQV